MHDAHHGHVSTAGGRRTHGVRTDDDPASTLTYTYRRGPVARGVEIRAAGAERSPPGLSPSRSSCRPGASGRPAWRWHRSSTGRCSPPSTAAASRSSGPRPPSAWPSGVARSPRWRPTIPALKQVVARSAEDLGALRIFDPDYPERVVVAAGAPWFMTVFGRDSLLTAWMALLVDPDLARGVLQTLARFQGQRGRSAPRGGAGPHPPRDAIRRRRLAVARRREHLLRDGRRHAAVRDAAGRDAPLGRGPRAGRRAASQRGPGHRVDRALRRRRRRRLRRVPPGHRPRAWPTRAGRTAGTASATATAGWPRRPSPSPRCRPTPTAPTWPAPTSPSRPGTPPPTTASGPRRPTSRPTSTATSGWRRRAGSPSGSTPTRSRSTRSTSNIGHCLWTGIVDEDKALQVAQALVGPVHVLGLGTAHAVERQRRVQPDQLPLRLGVAPRHRHRGRRPGPLRLRRRRPAAHLRPARRRLGPGWPPARAVQRPRSGRADRAGRLPDLVLAAGLGGGVAAAVPADTAPPRPVDPLRQDVAVARTCPRASAT